jgi:hypothetical protein
MVKMLALAIWATAIALFASSAATRWQADHAPGAAAQHASGDHTYEYRKSRVINVPIIGDGALLGYVIVQFQYGLDPKAAEKASVSPDAFIMDYAFRTLYGDPNLDFRHLEKYDITGLTVQLTQMLNERLGEGMVKEVLVQDFSYMPKEQAPR